jgi:hypothetical protein
MLYLTTLSLVQAVLHLPLRVFVNNELKRIWNKPVVVWLETLYWTCSGDAEQLSQDFKSPGQHCNLEPPYETLLRSKRQTQLPITEHYSSQSIRRSITFCFFRIHFSIIILLCLRPQNKIYISRNIVCIILYMILLIVNITTYFTFRGHTALNDIQ